jgi:hypothetical protein
MIIIAVVLIIALNTLFGNKNDIETIENFEPEEDYKIYRLIIDSFNHILGRNPSTSELFDYYKRVNENKITEKDLEIILQATDEYKRLEKTQNNMTNNQITTSINEEQIKQEVIEVYKKVFNKDPDSITIEYFKKKYIELNLDKKKLEEYLILTPDYKKYDALIKETEEEIKKENEVKGKYKSDAFGISQKDENITLKDGKMSIVINRPNIFNFVSGDREINQDMIDKANNCSSATASAMADMTNKTDSVTKTNIDTKQRNACERLTKESKCAVIKTKDLGKTIQQRNFDELRSKCRSSNYTNSDDFGKLLPDQRWSVPEKRAPVCYSQNYNANPLNSQTALIGTLLDDSNKTSVGSMLPKFKYDEEYTRMCNK